MTKVAAPGKRKTRVMRRLLARFRQAAAKPGISKRKQNRSSLAKHLLRRRPKLSVRPRQRRRLRR